MEKQKPINDIKFDIEIIKEKVTNVENDIKILKSISQDIRLLIDKKLNKEKVTNTSWFFN